MLKLEKKLFVATAADVREMTLAYVRGGNLRRRTGMDYFKATLGTTLADLGLKPRRRSVKARKLGDEERREQLKALKAVHKRFYPEVLAAIDGEPLVTETPLSAADAKHLRHRRANFARSAVSVLRRWIKAGHDLGSLSPLDVTKSGLERQLRGQHPKHRQTPAERVVRMGERVAVLAEQMGKRDREAASAVIQTIIARLSDQMMRFGRRPTTDAAKAAAEGRILRTDHGVFFPAVQAAANDEAAKQKATA